MENKSIRKVLVIMSTYNGEAYLSEQISSILNQQNVELSLVIRDDGSKDSTPEVINRFAENDSRITPVYGENMGFRKSFFNTLKEYASDQYDYVAFSDQDDVWQPQKLYAAIQKLELIERPRKLYTSSLTVVDQNLNPMYINSFNRLKISYGSAISRQRLAGCTMVFDKEAAELCKRYNMDEFRKDLISHDGAVYYICLACGGTVVFDDNNYIQFRRHTGTVTEHGKGIKKRVESILDIFGKNKNIRLAQTESLYSVYRDEMPSDILELSRDIIHYKDSLLNRLKLSIDKRIKCNIPAIDLVYAAAILAGCY